MISKFLLQKPNSTVAEKSFAIGTLADCMDAIGPAASAFVNHLYPVFMSATQEPDEEVRSNAVFAVGVLSANGGEAMFSYPYLIVIIRIEANASRSSDRKHEGNNFKIYLRGTFFKKIWEYQFF